MTTTKQITESIRSEAGLGNHLDEGGAIGSLGLRAGAMTDAQDLQQRLGELMSALGQLPPASDGSPDVELVRRALLAANEMVSDSRLLMLSVAKEKWALADKTHKQLVKRVKGVDPSLLSGSGLR